MFPLHYACSCAWWFQIVPDNVRSVEWRYGEEQIAMTDEHLSTPALELVGVESDLLDNIRVYFSAIVGTFGIAKAESVCKAIAAINVYSRSQAQN